MNKNSNKSNLVINKDIIDVNLYDIVHKETRRVGVYDLIRSKLRFDSRGRCVNALEVLSHPRNLYISYEIIKSNPGNMVPGVDKVTLDGLNEEWFDKTSSELRNGMFIPKPARKVYIPKPNGKMRPLGITSPRDKIVQQSMKLVLEFLLEPKFNVLSHGFRPGKSCHTALKEIRNWKGVPWIIEGDIKSFFPTIDHHLLESLLKKHISDTLFFQLYWKFVKSGYIEWVDKKRKFMSSDLGVPQGSIISPILSNLVLHELDEFLLTFIQSCDKINSKVKKHTVNPMYKKLSDKINKLRKEWILNKEGIKSNDTKLLYKQLIKVRNRTRSIIPNPSYLKVRYVRYADDWIIGLWSSIRVARVIRKMISKFLEDMKLELSFEKTKITNTRKDKAKFLGTKISRMPISRRLKIKDSNNRIRRISPSDILMTIPIREIMKRLQDKGLFESKEENKFVFKSIWKIIPAPAQDIVLRYRSIYSGLTNFYSFADNIKILNKVKWILYESLIRTLMVKFKTSKRGIIERFGKNISVNFKLANGKEKMVDFKFTDLKRSPLRFTSRDDRDIFKPMDFNIHSRYLFNLPCTNCNSSDKVEMHHLKHIRTINLKLSPFDQMVAKINRKQVPLCHTCHKKLHSGNYSGKKLK